MIPTPGNVTGTGTGPKQSYSHAEGEYMTAVKAGIDISQPPPATKNDPDALIEKVIEFVRVADEDLTVFYFDEFFGFEITQCANE